MKHILKTTRAHLVAPTHDSTTQAQQSELLQPGCDVGHEQRVDGNEVFGMNLVTLGRPTSRHLAPVGWLR